jgi:hypothetical protein
LFCALQTSLTEGIKGRNNGVNFLNLRTEKERDGITKDVYFEPAPGWTTLGFSSSRNGVKPEVRMPPAQAAKIITEVAATIPFFMKTIIFVSDGSSTKEVSLQYLEALNIPAKSVPCLYTSETPPIERIKILETQLAAQQTEIRTLQSDLAAMQEHVREKQAPGTPATVGQKRAREDADTPD